MDLDQLLTDLSQKYSFTEAHFKAVDQTPGLEIFLKLKEEHIERFVQKAGQLNKLVESCANMVTIFDDSASKEVLLQTSLRCVGNDGLCICTAPSMVKILIETLFD